MTREQGIALQKCDAAFTLDFAHPKSDVWTALRTANQLVEAIARNTGGLVWDEETREMFSPDAWRNAGQKVEVREEEVFDYIHVYPNKTRDGNTTAALLEKLSEGRQMKPAARPDPVDCKTE